MYICKACGAIKNETIAATGHRLGDWHFVTAPSYTKEGLSERVCSVCGYKQTKKYDRLVPEHIQHDEGTGVEIGFADSAYDGDISLDVEMISEGDTYDVLDKDDDVESFTAYEITTGSGGESAQPKSAVLVRLPIPGDYDRESLCVYYMVNGSVAEKIVVWIDGDYACFETTHFSIYALVQEIRATPGDVNGDGDVLANDARLALRASAQLENLDETQKKAADVDGNGEVLANDARLILRFSAQLETGFPVSEKHD